MINNYLPNDSGYMGSPSLPKTDVLDAKSSKFDSELYNAEWYWGDITREVADDLMAGRPNGSFLVRNSLNSNCEYTLTLKKDGVNKLIKIIKDPLSGKYGFAYPLTFSSVKDLIEFYCHHSLVEYNRTLNLQLGSPVSRMSTTNAVKMSNKNGGKSERHSCAGSSDYIGQTDAIMTNQSYKSLLRHVIRSHIQTTKAFDDAYTEFSAIRSALIRDKRALKCVKALAVSFSKQMELLAYNAETHKEELAGHEKDRLIVAQNYQFLKQKLKKINEAKEKLELEIAQEHKHCGNLEREFNGIKPELMTLHKKREQLRRQLIIRGVNQATIDRWIAEEEEYLDNNNQSGSTLNSGNMTPVGKYGSNRVKASKINQLRQTPQFEESPSHHSSPTQSPQSSRYMSTPPAYDDINSTSNRKKGLYHYTYNKISPNSISMDVDYPNYAPHEPLTSFSHDTVDQKRRRSSSSRLKSLDGKAILQQPTLMDALSLDTNLCKASDTSSPNTTINNNLSDNLSTLPRRLSHTENGNPVLCGAATTIPTTKKNIPRPLFTANQAVFATPSSSLMNTSPEKLLFPHDLSRMSINDDDIDALEIEAMDKFNLTPTVNINADSDHSTHFNVDANALPDWDTLRDHACWLVPGCDRDRAEHLLRGKPLGTFLIRPSSKTPFALSIRIPGDLVKHCLIYQSPSTLGYGFADSFPFKNIYELVDFYRVNSLADHNPDLRTTLKLPALLQK